MSTSDDTARIRGLLGILGALWERHPEWSFGGMLCRLVGQLRVDVAGQTMVLTDAELSDRITWFLNEELRAEFNARGFGDPGF